MATSNAGTARQFAGGEERHAVHHALGWGFAGHGRDDLALAPLSAHRGSRAWPIRPEAPWMRSRMGAVMGSG